MSKKRQKAVDPNLQYIQYEKARIGVSVTFPVRTGVCRACKRKVGEGIKVTAMHHAKYAYELNTVRNNPLLALDYALEFCFTDHEIADGLRMILLSNPRGGLKRPENVIRVLSLLPPEQQQVFTDIARMWLKNGKS